MRWTTSSGSQWKNCCESGKNSIDVWDGRPTNGNRGGFRRKNRNIQFGCVSAFTAHRPCPVAGLPWEGGEVSLWLDGQPIVPIENGWYVDPCIKTSELPCLSVGSHTLEVIRPFTPRTCLEWVYLLGNFRVKLSGRLAMLEPVQEEKAGYASLTEQGIPFYGGNASYVFDIETHGGALRLRVPQWRGALIAASIDGQDVGRIAFPPYSIETSPLPAGMHQICLKLFGTRANTFGPLHLADEKETWIGPGAWCSGGDAWTYEYRLKPFRNSVVIPGGRNRGKR